MYINVYVKKSKNNQVQQLFANFKTTVVKSEKAC